jgi:hypothetical protein
LTNDPHAVGVCVGVGVAVADDAIVAALSSFRGAPRELVERRVLQQRIDRKYVFAADLLEPMLAELSAHFSLVLAASAPLATYNTVYFDTPERLLYHNHRRGRMPRHKVRVRHHVERRLSFLEIKCKTGDSRTRKARTERPFGALAFDSDAEAFVAGSCPVAPDLLVPQVWMTFRRITLVGNDIDERVTIDCDLGVAAGQQSRQLPGVAVVEVKQARHRNDTASIRALRSLHLRERAFSKYCIGTALLEPVRSHAFQPALRLVDRLSA